MSDVDGGMQSAADVEQAAQELAVRLQALADSLAAHVQPRRVPYGPGRIGQAFRRQSPKGYILERSSLKMLLPDGRLWRYSRAESSRFPDGRTFDAGVDYQEFGGGRSSPGGREFVFLGAVVNNYSFGWAAPSEADGETSPGGLWALYGEGKDVRWVPADEAFTAITEAAITRQQHWVG